MLPVVQRAKVPVVILNLAPEVAIDYASRNSMPDRTKMTGEGCRTALLALCRHHCAVGIGHAVARLRSWGSCREWT
ncbi:MAG: hypothetical protein ABIX01_19835 [Chitinophagaceae bacterium]